MPKLCLGCMSQKEGTPVCEHCGYDERQQNLPHQLQVGTILQNQYLVGRVLGQGGFGITYMGWDQHLSKAVAIKEYYPNGVVQRHTKWGTDVFCTTGEAPEIFEKHRERFLKEARTLAQLAEIPQIVQIKSFFSANGTAYIVMEYVKGQTLKQHLKELGRPMTEAEALSIMEPVLLALEKVHEQNLIHRDISPDNIMLPEGGGVKLIDFGTVRYVDASGATKSTEAVLKPGFAPIEQYNSRGNLGTWTDVYAICATFHYLLTGKVPVDVHSRLEEGENLSILRSREGLSAKLIRVLETGMAVRASDRIQTLGELHRLLYSEQKEKPQTEKMPAGKAPRKKKVVVSLCAVLMAVIGVALLLWGKPSGESVKEPILESGPAERTPVSTLPEIQLEETEAQSVPQTTEPEVVDERWKDNVLLADPSMIYEDIKGDSSVFSFPINRKQVKTITFLDTVESSPDQWSDVSAAGDGRIRAWIEEQEGMYDLYIAADGGVNAPGNTCYTLFNGYVNAEHIFFNGNFHTDEAETMENMFYACKKLKDLDLTGFRTENVTCMGGMFWWCTSIESLDLSSFCTKNVTDMGAMFDHCSSMKTLDVSSFQTENVDCMIAMFYYCESLEKMDLTNFDTAKVTSMANMFWGCSKLRSVNVSTWDTSRVENMEGMFKNCPVLMEMIMGSWETDSVKNMENFRDSWWEMS